MCGEADPGVCAAKPATDRAGEADMVARIAIVLRQQLGPARTQLNAFTPNHGCVADARKCAINAGKFLGETEGEPKATQCIIWLDYISLFDQEEIGAKTSQSPERILPALFAEVA